MTISELLLPEFDVEMGNTRKALERAPMDKPDFKPHDKSMPLGYLARHVASLPDWIAQTILRDNWNLAPADGKQYGIPEASNTEELLAIFDDSRAAARNALAETTDEHMLKPWSLLYGEKVIFTQPRYTVVRTMLNHTFHHRAQLGVYLRLNDLPVPSLYGPSADEGQWG